jgi:hypothetical protein
MNQNLLPTERFHVITSTAEQELEDLAQSPTAGKQSMRDLGHRRQGTCLFLFTQTGRRTIRLF